MCFQAKQSQKQKAIQICEVVVVRVDDLGNSALIINQQLYLGSYLSWLAANQLVKPVMDQRAWIACQFSKDELNWRKEMKASGLIRSIQSAAVDPTWVADYFSLTLYLTIFHQLIMIGKNRKFWRDTVLLNQSSLKS